MNQPLFYQCVVLDNQDPLMLGRVRARLLTDNYNDMVKSFDDPPWNEEKDKWGNRDPFIFNPLLPFLVIRSLGQTSLRGCKSIQRMAVRHSRICQTVRLSLSSSLLFEISWSAPIQTRVAQLAHIECGGQRLMTRPIGLKV